MVSLQAVAYYLLGGVTFLPLCLLAGLVWFSLCAPLAGGTRGTAPSKSISHDLVTDEDEDAQITPERKAAAIEFAKRNAEAQDQLNGAGKADHETALQDMLAGRDSRSNVPGAAKRLGPAATILPRPHRSGWLTVRRQFEPSSAVQQQTNPSSSASNSVDSAGTGSNAVDNGTSTPSQPKPGYMSAMYRGIMDYRTGRTDGKKGTTTGASASQPASAGASPIGLAPVDASGHADPNSRDASPASGRSAAPPSGQPAANQTRESHYCILKSPILYFYSSDDVTNPATECLAAIDMRGKRVSMYINGIGDAEGDPEAEFAALAADGEGNPRKVNKPAVKDGELFQKRNAIRIISRPSESATDVTASKRLSEWFVFLKSATLLEDWYHALIHASLMPDSNELDPLDPCGLVFDTDDMQNLLTSLDSLPDPIPLRWLNAMVGRVFYSIYRTAWLEDYVTSKLMKKISRVRTPGFLSDIRVQEVHLGSTPPAFSKPMLKSLTGTGEASMEVGIHYTGNMRLTISTVLTIPLGSRFKPYTVSLVLAVVMSSLEGNLLLQIKPPPSNRVWYGFTQLPKMRIEVEPVVSERKVQWSLVKRAIEGRIKDLMTESMVVPNMDDIPFYDTRPNPRRGGIWSQAAVRKPTPMRNSGSSSSTSAKKEDASEAPHAVEVAEAETATTSARAHDKASGSGLRSRKSQGSLLAPSSQASLKPSASPAVAGLSALLARNAQSAGPGSTSATPISASAAPSDGSSTRSNTKKKSWFVAGSRNNSASSRLAMGNKRPQSSLAWGSASVSLPNQKVEPQARPDPGSTPLVSTMSNASSLGGDSVPDDASFEDDPEGEVESHRPQSIKSSSSMDASIKTRESAGTADTETAADALGREHAADGETEFSGSETRGELPISISAPSGHPSTLPDAAVSVPSLHLQEPSGDSVEDFDDTVAAESLASVTSAPESSMTAPPEPTAAGVAFSRPMDSPETMSLRSTASSADLPPTSSAELPKELLTPVVSDRSSGFGSPSVPPPPLPRRVPSHQPDSRVMPPSAPRHPSSAASDYLYRVRDASGPDAETLRANDGGLRNASPGTTQAALLASWNKARTTMADKDSRQAAAKDAKDAIKRGWANWHAKRADGRVGRQSPALNETPSTSFFGGNGSRHQSMASVDQEWDALTEASTTDKTLTQDPAHLAGQSAAENAEPAASTIATDPAALGGGFEMSSNGSPEWQRSLPILEGYDFSRQRQRDKSVGSESGSSYREYRASREASRAPSRTSSPVPSQAQTFPSHADLRGSALVPKEAPVSIDASKKDSERGRTTSMTSSSSQLVSSTSPRDGLGFIPRASQPITGLDETKASAEGSADTELRRAAAEGARDASPVATPRKQANETRTLDPVVSPSETRSSATGSTNLPSARPGSSSSRTSVGPTSPIANANVSPSTAARIRSQPGQRTMMAVPGIQKRAGEPMSFSAPAPPQSPANEAPGSASPKNSSSRLSTGLSSFKMPAFAFGNNALAGNGVNGTDAAAPATPPSGGETLTPTPSSQGVEAVNTQSESTEKPIQKSDGGGETQE